MALSKILPGTGRGTAARSAAVEGVLLVGHRLLVPPSTTPLRVAVPLPVNGEDLIAQSSRNVPSSTVTQFPPKITRSPSSRQSRYPPLALA